MRTRAAGICSQDDVTRRVHRLLVLALAGSASLLNEEHGLLLYWLLLRVVVPEEPEPLLSNRTKCLPTTLAAYAAHEREL